MQISKIAKMLVLGSGLVAAHLSVFVATASAGDRRGWQPREQGYHAPNRQRHVAPHYSYGRDHRQGYRRHDGAGLALGLGALIIGGVIASEEARHRDRH